MYVARVTVLLVCMIAALAPNNVQSQTIRNKLNIIINNNGSGSTFGLDTLVFGIHDSATYCLDTMVLSGFSDGGSVTEGELPPPPPTEIFDVRFVDPRGFNEMCMGQGLSVNIHKFSDTMQVDTFQIMMQQGLGGYPLRLKWSSLLRYYADSMWLKDLFGGFLVNVNMLAETTTVISNSAINQVRIYMYGPKQPPPPPVTPVLSSPANGAVDQASSVTLTWQSSAGALQYRLQMSLDSAFSSLFYTATTTSTSETVSNLEPLTTYYWRVSALNQFGSSSFSTPFRFTTRLFPPVTPTPISPADGAVDVPSSPTLQWSGVSHATSYHVQVAKEESFASLVVDTDATDTLLQVGPLENCVTHYWRVRAANAAGASAYSSPRSFTVISAIPSAPTLVSPADNASGVTERPTLLWNRNACAQSYRLQVDTNASFTAPIVNTTTSDTTFRFQFSLLPLTRYYWRVNGTNQLGTGAYAMRSFTTTDIVTPQMPVLASPSNGATEVSLTPTLQWTRVPQVEYFHVQVARDSLYNVVVYNDSLVADTFATVGPLPSSAKFYWRVRAKNAAGSSAFTESFTFTTIVVPPRAPFLISPANGAYPVSRLLTLEWDIPYGATSYRLQVARDSQFTVMAFDDSTIEISSWRVGPLQEGTVHYWRVQARNSAGVSPFSEIWSFRTTYSSPANWLIPLAVRETGQARDTVYFGVNPSASYGIDPSLGEYELPPSTPGFFDVRFVDIPSRPGLLGEGVRTNVLPFTRYEQVDTFKITFQPGMGTYPIDISWPQNFIRQICDSMLMIDEFNGFAVKVRMDQLSSVRVSNTSISSLMIIKWGSIPLISDVRRNNEILPNGYVLYPNYPNPFNPSTVIPFATEDNAFITIAVYDVLGKHVISLVQGLYSQGQYTVAWDARDERNERVPSGVYFVRMTARSTVDGKTETYSSTQRMLFLK